MCLEFQLEKHWLEISYANKKLKMGIFDMSQNQNEISSCFSSQNSSQICFYGIATQSFTRQKHQSEWAIEKQRRKNSSHLHLSLKHASGSLTLPWVAGRRDADHHVFEQVPAYWKKSPIKLVYMTSEFRITGFQMSANRWSA